MPRTLRRESHIRGIVNLVNETIFGLAFAGIALSLFFFSPERMISVRVLILSACCLLLLITASTSSRRKKRALRFPLLALSMGGVLFAGWGFAVVVRAALMSSEGFSVITGFWFILFGAATFATALRARM